MILKITPWTILIQHMQISEQREERILIMDKIDFIIINTIKIIKDKKSAHMIADFYFYDDYRRYFMRSGILLNPKISSF